MMNVSLRNNSIRRLFLLLLIAILVFSCKNESGENTSWFSSDTELGSAEEIEALISSPNNLDLFRESTVADFYENRAYEPAWNNDNLRDDLLQIFEEGANEGLYFQDYHGLEIVEKIENFKSLNDQEKSNLDILLTDAFFQFSNHLFNGKVDPRELHSIWDVPTNEIDMVDLLNTIIKNNDLEPALKKLRPNHIVYNQLIALAKEYKELSFEFEGWQDIPMGEMIKPEKGDERMPLIQERLKELKYLASVDNENQFNNEEVQEAIKKFQEENGLQADGIIGDTTIELLNIDYKERYEQILVNLERWRWYPRDLGEHYIIVNIANYNLHVIKDNDTVHTHRTMVGTEARKTPVFTEEIQYIVFNPTWTIPPTIQNDDVIPGMRKNSNYLSKKNINVFDQNGEPVNPSKINWSGEEAKSLTYMQKPGVTNPLGQVKIMYPNEYLIYLHDTPSRNLFERNSRDQSSGCVRVENAVDLAKYLLNDQTEYSSEKIDEIIATGDTKQIDMKQKVNVHHFYWTAWEENEGPRFTADIYGYDKMTFEALKNAS